MECLPFLAYEVLGPSGQQIVCHVNRDGTLIDFGTAEPVSDNAPSPLKPNQIRICKPMGIVAGPLLSYAYEHLEGFDLDPDENAFEFLCSVERNGDWIEFLDHLHKNGLTRLH